MGRIRWPWARSGTAETVYPLPGVGEIQDDVVPVVIGGICDSRGILRSYIEFGESVPLPAADSQTIIMAATSVLGGANQICPSDVDMTYWADLWVEVQVYVGNMAAGELTVILLGASGDNEIGVWDAGEQSPGFRIDNPATIVAGESFYCCFRGCGGLPVVSVRLNNGNVAARTFVVAATRFRRVHGSG